MKSKISKVLVSPAGLLGLRYGTDAQAAAELLTSLARQAPSICFTAVARAVDERISFPKNVRILNSSIRKGNQLEFMLRYFQDYRVGTHEIKRIRPDLVHHLWPMPPHVGFDGAAATGRLNGTPLIIGPLLAAPPVPEHTTQDHFIGERPLQLLYRRGVGAASPLLHALFLRTLKSCDALITVNYFTRETYSKFVSRRKIHVVPWGVDTDKYRYVGPRKNKTVLILGALWYRKGHQDLLTAFAEVVKRVPTARLGIIGQGPQRDNLVNRASHLGILDRVTFHGFIEPEGLPLLLQDAQVFCLPTLHEAFGLSLVEAMASGLPCISTLTTGPREIIEDGESGYLVEPGDVQALTDRLVALLTDYELCETMGAAGRRIVMNRFRHDDVARQYLDLYSRVRGGADKSQSL